MFGKLTYAPHDLYLVTLTKSYDGFGNYEGETESAEFLCRCRCDDVSVNDAITVNGEKFIPSYHIVSEKQVGNGAYVRVKDGDTIRAEGKVVKTTMSNYFKLFQAWI